MQTRQSPGPVNEPKNTILPVNLRPLSSEYRVRLLQFSHYAAARERPLLMSSVLIRLIDGRGPGFPRRREAKKFGPFFPPQNILYVRCMVSEGVRVRVYIYIHIYVYVYTHTYMTVIWCMVSKGVRVRVHIYIHIYLYVYTRIYSMV